MRHEKSLRDQILIVLSPELVATTKSTGENAADHTPRLCPRHTPTSEPSAVFHT